ncbi:MAG TPA: G8 domain-containing protein [Steroidobacteraceae bacterium]|nr:G8 domain-containing protein [Steroidobacteraceae bacterium]
MTIGGQGGCGPSVEVDQDFTGASAFGDITIGLSGTLSFPSVTRELDLNKVTIKAGGELQIGTTANPIGKTDPSVRITLKFFGARPCKSPEPCGEFYKGIKVELGGSLVMVGWKGVTANSDAGANPNGVSWTRLNAPAAKGSSVLTLADDVSEDWQPLDFITVATTTYSPFETEFVQISNVTKLLAGGSQVTLMQPLKHDHYGHLPPTPSKLCAVGGVVTPVACSDKTCNAPCTSAPSLLNFNDPAKQNFGVDERAEVGLITRNIKLTADIPKNDPNSLWWGGETKILAKTKPVVIQGVEFEKFGKDQLGSYPIRFFKAGNVAGAPVINANSVHHSFNHCLGVNSTENLTFQNNVCARIIGHIFYEETGDEKSITFANNLGLGAMSQWFGIDFGTVKMIIPPGVPQDYWEGDHLADPPNCGTTGRPACSFGYNGMNVPDVDDQTAPTHSDCFLPDGNGGLRTAKVLNTFGATCDKGQLYEEPASGFWLVNPGTNLTGNSIGGCQGVGVGIWYVPPPDTLQPDNKPRIPNPTKFTPIGAWRDNHAHGCYDGFFGETQFGLHSEQPQPKVGGKGTNKNLIATFDGLTSTRNRDRGVWLRPLWSVFKNGRFATSRDDVSLVSSGGLDGNAPGVWALLEDSVLLGISANNVDRFGPCPQNRDPNTGCVDRNPLANDILERGYPSPFWNFAGFMIYDGPVRIFHDRFINFNKNLRSELTAADQTYFDSFTNYPNASGGPYEGDAALGWFQSNQSSYPTGTVSRDLIFENTDLRHQIYTDAVNLAAFNDGDQNTSILDMDGTLTGFKAVDSTGAAVPELFPDSLNNLEFNGASNSVDECLAQGAQDDKFEGRPTSLISPANMGTLEFGTLFPKRSTPGVTPVTDATQLITITKDNLDYGAHKEEALHGRNGQGLWEPKAASGFGYTFTASPITDKIRFPLSSGLSGIGKTVNIGFTDVIKPDLSPTKPFAVRVGICYTDLNGNHPPGKFTITKGYKSYGGNGTETIDRDLQKFFANLDNRFQGQFCINLDDQNANKNIKDDVHGKGCPANGVIPLPDTGCPADGSVKGKDQQDRAACIYPIQCTDGDSNCPCPNGTKCGREASSSAKFHSVAAITDLTNADGTPKDLNGFFYDATNGMLFFYVTQDLPNAFGPSPLGSCSGNPATDDPSCPDIAHLENYYACPAQGCQDYVVNLHNNDYSPGPSTCGLPPGTPWSPNYDPATIYSLNGGAYAQPVPPNQNQLVYSQNNSVVLRKQPDPQVSPQGFEHSVATVDPQCPNPTPPP